MPDQEATSNPAETEAEPAPTTPGEPDAAQPATAAPDPAQPATAQAPAASAAPEAKPAGMHASYAFLVVVTFVSLVLDLASKWWAKSHFEALRPRGNRQVVVIEDVVNLIYAKNRGGAWGLLQNETEALRRPFFLIVSVAAIVFIVSLYRKLQPGQTALKWGLPLVLGGALGNLVDRIRYGFVVDFIDVFMKIDGKVKHWPTFNIADVAICIGVGLMAIDMFTSRRDDKTAPPAGAAVPQASDAAHGGEASAAIASAPETVLPAAELSAATDELPAATDGDSPDPVTSAEGT